MKLNSIQFKFLTTILAAMLAITMFIGGLSIYEVDKFIQRQTEDYIHAVCEKEATQVNDIFGDMEKSVNIMSGYVLDYFKSVDEVQDRTKQNEIIQHSNRMFADVANHTDGAVAYYMRFAMEISDSKTGFFFTKDNGSDVYTRTEVTDLTLFDRDDTEHVGWYWQPYEAGEPVWMQPYLNKNNGITTISYVVPLYFGNQFIGIVGMDFDYNILVKQVHSIKIYENGFAHLEMDGVPLHNDGIPFVYDHNEYLQASTELANGMSLVLSASYEDIRQIRYDIELRILFTVLILAVVFSLIAVQMVKKIVKPLTELTHAAKNLADRNYDVPPIQSNTYEIQLLGTAFENMSLQLREHEKMQHLLAYRDSLTGLRNTTSFKVWVTDFDKEIQNKNAEFGVILLDVNYLKETNDKYGHDVGNKLIVAAAQLISGIYKRSPVFRIGGDEFLVILQNRDLENREELCKAFDLQCQTEHIEAGKESIPVNIAHGFAKYDAATDTQFLDVFNRADDAMYQHKRKMKSSQPCSQLP